jgi:UDP-GlcNAc:undecaprenyl-phosphate GlcNAc-1-phosphate transferase
MRGDVSFNVLMSMGMTGALLGFLYYNFPPAKIYMGDGGAYMLGFLISALSIQGSKKGLATMALLAPVFALAVPIVDVALAIMRRGVRGLPIFRPDRKHIHHRLAQLGLSPLKAVLILYGLSLVFLSMGFLAFWTEGKMLPVLIASGALVVIVGIRSLGWIHEMMSVRHLMGDSGKLRRNVRYALALCEWFDLSAERYGADSEFWDDFVFCLRKLGFSRVVVRQGGTERVWQGEERGVADLIDRHEVNFSGQTFSLEFHGVNSVLESKSFFLLTELMAEAWLRAGRRWNQTHAKPLALAEVRQTGN